MTTTTELAKQPWCRREAQAQAYDAAYDRDGSTLVAFALEISGAKGISVAASASALHPSAPQQPAVRAPRSSRSMLSGSDSDEWGS